MIRPATLSDVPAVAALEEAVFGLDAWSEQMVEQELTGERRKAWVADDLAGYAVVMESGDVTDLLRIAVAPSYRRRGTARGLLAAAMAASEGERMLLEVSAANAGALAFYAQAGFVEIDRRPRYYRDGTDAVVMRASLRKGC